MTKLESIVVSNTEPNSKNVLWYDNKRLLIFSNGSWSPIVDLDDIDVDNLPGVSNLQEALKSLNIKVDNKVDKVELNKALTTKQDKLVNSADVTVGEDDKLTVTEEAKRKAFIDQWNIACKSVAIHGKYNENTGYFELNGLTDISYEQALNIDRQSEIYSDSNVCGGYSSRTLYPIHSSASGWFPVSFFAKFENSTLEVINFSINPQLRTSAVSMFANCRKLRVIKGIMTLATSKPNDVIDMFKVCPELRELQLKSLKISISFSDSPLLSLDSISYMVTNAANTSPITITLHPDAYARLTDEIITAATAKQINFATETA